MSTKHRLVSLVLLVAIVSSLFLVMAAPAGAVTAANVVVTPSPATASAQAAYTITFDHTAAAPAGTVITVTMPAGVVLPASISKTNWKFGAGATAAAATAAAAAATAAEPDLVISGQNLLVPVTIANPIPAGTFGAIVISQLAGIKNPPLANAGGVTGRYKAIVASSVVGEATATAATGFAINAAVTISPTAGPRGTTINVSGVGFTPTTTANITGGGNGSAVVAADGTVTATVSASASAAVTITDGNGIAAASAAFTRLPTATLSPTDGLPGSSTVVTGTDFTAGGTVVTATVANVETPMLVLNDAAAVRVNLTQAGAALPAGGTYTITFPATVTVPAATVIAANTTIADVTTPGVTIAAGGVVAVGQVVTITTATAAIAVGDVVNITFTAAAGLASASGVSSVTSVVPNAVGSTATVNIVTNQPAILAAGTAAPGSASFRVRIPANATTGIKTVALTDSAGLPATAQFTVNARTLTVSPTSGVPNNQFTVSGAGFTPNSTIAIGALVWDPTGAAIGLNAAAITIDSSGNFATTAVAPTTVGGVGTPGRKTVRATDGGGVVGNGSFTVENRVVTLGASSGARGSTLQVSGTGFSASGNVTVAFAGTNVGVGTNNAAGAFGPITVTVPTGAAVGLNTITVTDTVLGAAMAVNSNFTVLAPTLSVSPTSAASGSTVRVSGSNYPGFIAITGVNFGVGGPIAALNTSTSATGTWSADVMVPALAVGPVVISSIPAGGSTILTVVAAPAQPTTVAAAFAPIAGKYSAVWNFNAATQTYKVNNPAEGAPKEFTTLTAEEVYVIVATEATTITNSRGVVKNLVVGTNFISW